jgi:TetR/AcrR family transcriptional regulator, mexJK operon transcriptional repressor
MPMNAEPSRKERKRSEIVAIAAQIFFEEGYAGASMAQIAGRVGGSKATLYNHFASKQELFLAVVKDVAERQPLAAAPTEAEIKNATKDLASFRKWLIQFGADSLKRLTSYELLSLQRLSAAEAARLPEVGRAFFEGYVQPVFANFAPVFATAIKMGLIRKTAPEQAAEHFSELCLGWTLRSVLWGLKPPPSDAEINASVKSGVAAFLDGYASD